MTEQQPRVSVVIPAYNEERRIARCLASLASQSTQHAFEVILVDSSQDDTPNLVRRQFPQVKVIHREQQTFAAEARNIGIDHARGEIVAFIDADCVADQRWIDAVVAAHQGDHPAVGGPVQLDSPATLAGVALFGIEFSEYGRGSPEREIRWLPSCNLAVKRAALEAYGGFPTEMQASEDMLFTRRLIERSGSSLWFDPAMVIRHSNRNTFRELKDKLSNLGYWSGRSRATGVIPGGFILRYPALIPLLVPYRLINVLGRLLLRSKDGRLVGMALLGWPFLIYGLIWWAVAFRRGAASVTGGGPNEPGG